MRKRHANGRFKKGRARSKKGGGVFDFIHKPGTKFQVNIPGIKKKGHKFKFQPQKLGKDIAGQAEAEAKRQVMKQVRKKMDQYGIPREVIPYLMESQALLKRHKALKKKNSSK